MKNRLSGNIETAWKNIQKEVEESNVILISSEKTLVFKFAMELAKLYNCEDIVIDFEVQLYEEIDGSDKYLDLLVYELKKPNEKYAIEFKAPMKSASGNSNQTDTRKKIYKDIARLAYLKEKKENICNGYFLMITDENPYFKSSNNRDNTHDTANEVEANLERFKKDYSLENDYNFQFIWENINENSINGRFAWLEYIKV
jgi:ribosomal protein L29